MELQEQIQSYINSLPATKRTDMQQLHHQIIQWMPGSKQWYLDGKDANGKVVTNPNIGYGQLTLQYKDGSSKEFYQVGISANTTGISVYIMGLKDKDYLPKHFGSTIGKAKVTGYCIHFKSLGDIHVDVLEEAIRFGIDQTSHVAK